MQKTSLMDDVDLIMELEGGEVVIEDYDDWCRVKDLARDWSSSMGYYGRLYRDMCDYEEYAESHSLNGELQFPIYM